MTPAIAVLREVYPDRPADDRLAATLADFDDTGTYRLRVMRIVDIEEWVAAAWDGPRDYQLALD